MSCELPVVATSGTSMEEFMLPDISYPVKSNGWKPDPRCDWITNQYKDNLFADPDYISYRDAVWDIYSDRETAKNKGIRARQFVIENYDYKVITLRMKNRLKEIMNGKLSAESFWPHKYV
jgi:glycosyltransferase involved in cell wall biosynthesis